ncbi:MAG: leucyl aminopeptidase [Steroidobacteraceae bacterium]
MELHAVSASVIRQRTDCAIVGVYEKGLLSAAATELDGKLGKQLSRLVKQGDVRGKLGETLLLSEPKGITASRVLLVGLGPKDKFGRKQYRKALGAALTAVTRTGSVQATSYLSQETVAATNAYYLGRCSAEVAAHNTYRIPDLKTAKKPPVPALKKLSIAILGTPERVQAEKGLKQGAGIAMGMSLTRDLGNLPANICTPTYLAKTAQQMARDHRGSLKLRVLELAEIRKLKMGAFLSVTAGSDEPPRLIVLEYHGGKAKEAPIALVGKGITFDTGGISIKPATAMDEMKYDMCGAATVLGVFKAVVELKLPINLVGVIPTCENMPSGRATKPGDIVKSMSGQTIEVLNTDAEGRLILCDALTYARRFAPKAVIDIATLTGACVIALGNQYSGLFSNDDELSAALSSAGKRAEDGAWPMPSDEEYADQLKSNFADMANIGGREGGAITAACFLAKFTQDLKWAHLDIAGTAWLSGANKGGTGRPVPLLMDYLINSK